MTTLIQNEQKRQKIMARMREHLVPVLEHCRGGWVGLFLQGSQNYNLDYEGSDIDTKAIMLPSFSDFVLNAKPLSTTHIMENNEHVDFKDIRLMFDCIKKQNVNFVEILFTPYSIINPEYADLFQPVLDAREEIARYNNYRGIVVDSETVSFNSILDPDVDIDHSYSPGMSAVSQAVMDLLIESGLVWEKDITIVGRGHAVKELAKYLDFNNATVTVAHSKTKSLLQATQNRDVVIYATPIITQDISYNTRDLVIDLGNSVPHPDRLNCPYVNRIGQLTVSILLNRFAKKESVWI